ncbi:MAG: AbrB/MazE/SpoVT family DNA-binding domain-containing protein [Acidimicrobiia bacterium]
MTTQSTTTPSAIMKSATMNTQGRVVVPVEIRKAMGIEAPADLFFRYEDGTLTVGTIEDAVAYVQSVVAKYVDTDGSAVDALIADRRAEAAKEW